MRTPFELFMGEDGLWRAKFAPKVATELGPAAAFFVRAPSKKTAKEIAGILVSHALLKLKTSRGY